ncbi:hypothetical protein ABPG77_001774 [Micractinium sp. CCAP 211/92]
MAELANAPFFVALSVVFSLIKDVPPLTLASWRLGTTSVLLGAAAIAQWRAMPRADQRRTLQQAPLLAASGACLCVHFGTWVYSVQATSLTHSLLFVSATPLFLAGGAWLLRQPISAGELAGTGVGAVGAVLLATAAARSDAEVTVVGDMAALLASLCFVGYLLIGRRLRKWMPVMVYAVSVTGLAAGLLCIGGLLFEGSRVTATGRHGVFGWVSPSYLPYVLYLAVVPGIVGHTGFNTLLKYMDPLVISLSCNLEPLIGSLLGWAAGVVSPPSAMTYVGGALVMASTFVVSYAAHMREKQHRSPAGGQPGLGGEEDGAAGEEAQLLVAMEGRSEAAARKGSGRVGDSASSEVAVAAPALGAAAAAAAEPGSADTAQAGAALASVASWDRVGSWSRPEQSPADEQIG